MNPTLSVPARLLLPALLLASSLGAQQKNPDLAPYMMSDRAAEIALARTAAPANIGDSATVLVLARTGFVEASHGTNGFTCVVFRSFAGATSDPNFWNAKVRAPQCLNPPASRTVLPELLKRTEWTMSGVTTTELECQDQARLRRARVRGSCGRLDGLHAVAQAVSHGRRSALDASPDVLL